MTNLHTDPSQTAAYTRRQFVGAGLVMASAAAIAPSFLHRSAFGMPAAAPGMSSIPGVPEDRILVIVQLGGGNDGLNTVVPYEADAYHNARRGIRILENQVHKLDERGTPVGLHPAMDGIKSLFDEGLCGVVQGVGYPNPNRSHFKSMDIWHTADLSGTGTGWLGRYVDAECCGFGAGESGSPDRPAPEGAAGQAPTIHPPIAIGREAPLALHGGRVSPIGFETPDLFRWTGEDVDERLGEAYQELASRGAAIAGSGASSNADFLMQTAMDAQVSGDMIRRAVDAKPLVDYPRSGLAQQLSMVGNMIRAGMKTRIYYVTLGGFDTHAGQGGQNGRHANLLRQFAQAVNAFYRDLKAQGNEGRVLTLSFSEFGRRVSQNASGGTDHGTAAPVFLFGPMVQPGVVSRHPSLTDLDGGDLKYLVDFRTVYASILEDWLGADSEPILDGRYRKAPVLRV